MHFLESLGSGIYNLILEILVMFSILFVVVSLKDKCVK